MSFIYLNQSTESYGGLLAYPMKSQLKMSSNRRNFPVKESNADVRIFFTESS